MTLYGNTTTSGNDHWNENQGTQNQQGFLVSSVPKGALMSITLYCAGGLGGTCRTQACLWDSSGTLIIAAGTITLSAGGGGINAQAWHTWNFGGANGIPIAGGNYYIGFFRNSSDAIEWSWNAGSGTLRPTVNSGVGNVGSPSNLSVGTGTTGSMSAYLTWAPSGVYGADTAGSPTAIIDIYGNHLSGSPVELLGVYRGPSGGGTPIQIW